MKTLLEYREKMKLFLGKYDIYIFPVLKFALALIVFLVINANVGFMSRLTNPGIALVLALICSFLPLNITVVFGAILILIHMYALSLEAFAITFVLFALMFLLFFRTAPRYGYLLIVTPLAFCLGIPYLIPLAMGLAATLRHDYLLSAALCASEHNHSGKYGCQLHDRADHLSAG